MEPNEFIAWLAPSAKNVCQKYKLYASVCIAQAAIESSWGQNTIGQYNIFGIKAFNGQKAITVSTQEYINGKWIIEVDEFKDYQNLEEAIEDYCIKITQESLYEEVLYWLDDIEQYVRTLSKLYYGDNEHSEKIMNIIENYDLMKYD